MAAGGGGSCPVARGVGLWRPDGQHRARHPSFDGHEVGRLETEMWKAYYNHQRVRLFLDLTRLIRQQYIPRVWRAAVTGFYGARSAVVFQRGHDRPYYLLALPDLERFYEQIRRSSTVPFDVKREQR